MSYCDRINLRLSSSTAGLSENPAKDLGLETALQNAGIDVTDEVTTIRSVTLRLFGMVVSCSVPSMPRPFPPSLESWRSHIPKKIAELAKQGEVLAV